MSKEYYKNNINLKKTNVNIEYNDELIKEIKKCKNDIIYFAEKYIKINTLDKGLKIIELYPYQKDIIKKISENRFVVILSSRQSGKTTTCLIPILHGIIFNRNWAACILADKRDNAKKILDRLKIMYENLPKWLQHGIKVWQKTYIELENGSFVLAEATTPNSGRSHSFNYLFLDEFAIIDDNIANSFYASTYPTISSGKKTKIIIASTPKGYNLFYKIFSEAKSGINSYVPIEVRWNQVPNRDEKFKEETIKNIGLNRWRVEYECNFLGSNQTLVPPELFETFLSREPVDVFEDFLFFKKIDDLKVDKFYLMTFDVSDGIGKDYSAATVIDINKIPYEVICTYKDNKINQYDFIDKIYKIYKKFNNNLWLLSENNIYYDLLHILVNDYNIEKVICSINKNGRQVATTYGEYLNNFRYGVRMNHKLKRIGCINLLNLLEKKEIIINDFRIINELHTFIKRGDTYQADYGYNDDLTICLVLFGWFTTQDLFQRLSEKFYRDKFKQIYLEDLIEYDILSPKLFKNNTKILEKNEEIIDNCIWKLL